MPSKGPLDGHIGADVCRDILHGAVLDSSHKPSFLTQAVDRATRAAAIVAAAARRMRATPL